MIMAGTSARWGCCWRGYTDGAGGAREAKSSAKLDHHLRGTGSSPSRNRISTFAEPGSSATFGQWRSTTRSSLTVRTGITARKEPASWSQFLLGRSVSLEAADAQGAAAGQLVIFFRFPNVAGRVLVYGRDA